MAFKKKNAKKTAVSVRRAPDMVSGNLYNGGSLARPANVKVHVLGEAVRWL